MMLVEDFTVLSGDECLSILVAVYDHKCTDHLHIPVGRSLMQYLDRLMLMCNMFSQRLAVCRRLAEGTIIDMG